VYEVEAYRQGHPEDNKGQGDQDQGPLTGQILALFSLVPGFALYWGTNLTMVPRS